MKITAHLAWPTLPRETPCPPRRARALFALAALALASAATLAILTARGRARFAAPVAAGAPTLAAQVTLYAPLVLNPAQGGRYYVDSASGSDANTGASPDQAWKTFAPVHRAALQPGDAVLLRRGGQWAGPLRLAASGGQGRPIVVGAYGEGAAPVIDGAGARSGCCVEIIGDWVTVEYLSLRNADYAGVRVHEDAEYAVVRACEIADAGIGVAVFGRNNLVAGNTIHNLHMVVNTPGGDDDYGAVGVWLFAANNEVAYNVMWQCRAFSYDYTLDGGAIEFYGAVSDCSVHHNWAQDCEGFIEVGGGEPYGRKAHRNVVAYNVLVDNRRALLFNLGAYQYAADVQDFRFENNTVIESRPWKSAVLFVQGELTGGQLVVRNNIFAGFAWLAEQVRFDHTYNLYQGLAAGHPWEIGEFSADPRFTNAAADVFTLQSDSPAIDVALNLGYTLDYLGRAVPHGPRPDLGAYEYSGE